MNGYQAIIDEIRRASGAAEDAADIAGGVDLAATIGPVGRALAGSRTATSVGALAPHWTDRVATWSTDVRTYAGNLTASADLYATNEEQAARDLRVAGGGMRAE